MSIKQAGILLLAPTIGLLLDAFWHRRGITWMFWICAALFLPLLGGYYYVVSFIIPLACLLAASAVYYFLTFDEEESQKKIRTCMLITFLGFCIWGPIAFFSAFAGSTRVERKWVTGSYDYKIEHIVSQGFAGGPLNTYRISRFTYIPILLKPIDTTSISYSQSEEAEEEDGCVVEFKRAGKDFNMCTGVLTDHVSETK